MIKTKRIVQIGIGIALYVVLSMLANVPIVGHVRFDAGYMCYAVYLDLFGWWAIIVGVVGCFIKGYVSDGWIPFTWMVGQTIVGVSCAAVFAKTDKPFWKIAVIVVSVILGIGIVSSVMSALMFGQPILMKIGRGMITAAADIFPMMIGMAISSKLKQTNLSYFQ